VDEPRDDRVLRASDADRERVAELLRQAAGDGRLTLPELHEWLDALYAAKTYGELEPVVADLPDAAMPRPSTPPPARVAPMAGMTPARVGGRPMARTAKAVFGGLTRRGEWVVPSDNNVKVVFGGVELDLREARLESPEVLHAAAAGER